MTLVQAPTQNQRLLRWIDEMVELCQPDAVHWCDGSDAEFEMLSRAARRSRAPSSRSTRSAAPAPSGRGPTPKTSHASRTARSSAPTREIDAGPTNNWKDPAEMRATLQRAVPAAACAGRTMYVVPFSMGPLGSPLSYIGVEITDSPYVAVSMRTMTRAGQAALDVLGPDGDVRARACTRSARRSLRARPTSPGRATPTRSGSCTSPRRARSGRSDPGTAATPCSGRSASRCGSRR